MASVFLKAEYFHYSSAASITYMLTFWDLGGLSRQDKVVLVEKKPKVTSSSP